MHFEEMDVFDEKGDHVALVLNSIEGRYFEKFIKLLSGGW